MSTSSCWLWAIMSGLRVSSGGRIECRKCQARRARRRVHATLRKLIRVAVVVSDERLDAVDLADREDGPVLILRCDEYDRPFQRYGLRVEHIVMVAVNELDAEGFEGFRVEKPAKPKLDHVPPRSSGGVGL